jgi:hypothetical protein
MYHPTKIGPLSESQISKALKGLPVRVSSGNQHDIELSKEQLKKFAKAQKLGKAMNITLDPFQIQNHLKLIGSGVNRLKKGQRWEQFANATIRDGIDTAGKASRVYYDSTGPMAQLGMGVGGNITKVAKDSGKRLIVSGTDRAIRAIDGSGFRLSSGQPRDMSDLSKKYGKYVPPMDTSGVETDSFGVMVNTGGSVNRLKKGKRWEQFANATIRDGIDTAGKAARVYNQSTGPMAQLGFGLKKRGRPRKSGGALYVAGS